MRIVYAEDDPLVRAAITMLLVDRGVDVHEARDGGEAIMLCRTFRPDAVLLDLGMPNIDGKVIVCISTRIRCSSFEPRCC